MSEFTAAMAFTVPSEGGYQCIHGDPGNWTSGRVGAGALIGTNRGVSAPVLAAWLGREPTVADMKALTATTQNAIFAAGYWNPIRGDELPPGVSLSTYDMQVNAGKGGAECLQEAAGLSGDDVEPTRRISPRIYQQPLAKRYNPRSVCRLMGKLARTR
jgi:lysozyme family protein